MTTEDDCTASIAVRLQIINYDPSICSDDDVGALSSSVEAINELSKEGEKIDGRNCQPTDEHRRIKRKRGYKHDENATIYISQEDLDHFNADLSDSSDGFILSDGMACRLSNQNGSHHLTGNPKQIDAQETSFLVSDDSMVNCLWAPVILRVLTAGQQYPSSNTSSDVEKSNAETLTTKSDLGKKQHRIPTILIPPCIGATIGIHWFYRNNTQMMTADLQPLPRSCIVEGSSATVREIGHLSPLMLDSVFNSWDCDDEKDISTTDTSENDIGNSSSTTEEERQLQLFFLSKRQDADYENQKHLHPSCRTSNPVWKPRQRLLTLGSIFATPVITNYCDCYNRIFCGGSCKESVDNVRFYQVVDIQSSQIDTDSDDETHRNEVAFAVSPMTHLTLQPRQSIDDLDDNEFTPRLPRPSFVLFHLRSIGDNSNELQKPFGCVSTQMSKSNPNAIYHPSAKVLADTIYLQGVGVAAFCSEPKIISIVGESENHIRSCVDEAADMMGMRSLHVGGLAAFLVYYNSMYNRDDTRSILNGGLFDKLKGLDAALKAANECSPCVLHVEGLDHELTPATGQMGDASGREEEERRILQVIRDNTPPSNQFNTVSSLNTCRHGHAASLSMSKAPKVIVVFSSSDTLHPGPISASLQQKSVTINPPDTNYARALWDDDIDGTFEAVSASLKGLSANDISYLRLEFRHECKKRSLSNACSETNEDTPISILEPLLKKLAAMRELTQPSRNGGAGGSNNLPLATSSLPNVRWEDIGGMDSIRKEIMDAVELPLKYPHYFQGSQRAGILFYGPPGTGKTLVAKAVARECGLPFLSIKGPELLGSYVGESEANIRAVFDAARSAALNSGGSGSGGYSGASVLFFDELDSLAPRRGDTGFGDGVMDRVVSTLLSELDGGNSKSMTKNGVEARIIVIGATNRPDLLDPSLLRPGRFDRLLYLGPAKTKETMLQILKAQTRKFKFEPGSDSDTILMKAMESFPPTLSGADLSAVATKALMCGLKRVCDEVEKEAKSLNLKRDPSEPEIDVDDVMQSWSKEQLEPVMCIEDFIEAAKSVVPSISEEDLENFEKIRLQFSSR